MKRNTFFRILPMAALASIILMLVSAASAQHNFNVVYQFVGDESGFAPSGSPILDAAGNLYGNLVNQDYPGTGMVYKLTPSNPDAGWTESVLYSFSGGADGAAPEGDLALDPTGNLYGTSVDLYGGGAANLVFKLAPHPDGTFTESVLYPFSGGADGGSPYGGVILDAAGNLYGTTSSGGAYGAGVVFKLTPQPDGTWTEYVLHSFSGGADGANPQSGLISDTAGNLYGTTPNGGAGAGVVFKLTQNPDGTWIESVLYAFVHARGGAYPQAGVSFDTAGNLYSTTWSGGTSGNGTVFQLRQNLDGSWTEHVLHNFTGGSDGCHPQDGLTVDNSGNLYGTTGYCGDNGYGVAFQLKRHKSGGGGWTSTLLREFNVIDGISPCRMIFDPAGNLYGTTRFGGAYGYGTAFQIVH